MRSACHYLLEKEGVAVVSFLLDSIETGRDTQRLSPPTFVQGVRLRNCSSLQARRACRIFFHKEDMAMVSFLFDSVETGRDSRRLGPPLR